MDGQFVCLALSSKYVVVDIESGYIQELFPYDGSITVPLVKRITKVRLHFRLIKSLI